MDFLGVRKPAFDYWVRAIGLLALSLFLGCGRQDVASLNEMMLSAVVKGDTAQVTSLLEQGATLEARNSSGRTPLMLAALQGNVKLLDLLLEKGADIRASDTAGMTPLLWGAFGGNAQVVEHLLAHGADALAKDKSGNTAMNWAKDHPKVLVVLKRAGGKPKP